MNLVVHQVSQLQEIHISYRYPVVKGFPGTSVINCELSVTAEIGFFQSIHDINLGCPVKNRSGNMPSQLFCSQAQMHFQHLTDIHTGRNSQRVQADFKRRPIRQEWHILLRQHPGNHTLVPMSSGHFISNGYFSLLRNIATNQLIDTRGQLVAVLPQKDLHIHNDAAFPVRHLQGSIPDLTGFFPKNSTKQTFLCRQLSLPLGSYLAHQNVSSLHLCTNSDNAPLIQIL